MSDPIITFRNVSKAYGTVQALDTLCFQVPARGCVGLLGPNGAGKTTAIKALLHLVRIDAGSIQNKAQRIGYVPQLPALFPWLSGEEHMMFATKVAGLPATEGRKVAEHWLHRLDLVTAQHRRVAGYSGGMKQRLGLAMAMAQNPDVLVLDEPVSALDPIGRHEILHLLTELKQDRCIIMSTHILNDAERVCDDVVIIRSGRAVLQEAMDTLRNDMTHRYRIELTAPPKTIETIQQHLAHEPWVRHVTTEGPTIWCTLAEGSKDAPRLFSFLGSLQTDCISRVEKSSMSLEDVFLQVVNET